MENGEEAKDLLPCSAELHSHRKLVFLTFLAGWWVPHEVIEMSTVQQRNG